MNDAVAAAMTINRIANIAPTFRRERRDPIQVGVDVIMR
jgi:hypothetical protein